MPLTGAQFPHFLAKSAFLDWIFLDVSPSNRNKRMTKRYRWKRARRRASHLVRLPVFPARSVRPHALPLRPAPALSCSRRRTYPIPHLTFHRPNPLCPLVSAPPRLFRMTLLFRSRLSHRSFRASAAPFPFPFFPALKPRPLNTSGAPSPSPPAPVQLSA